jgi:Putative Ig domain
VKITILSSLLFGIIWTVGCGSGGHSTQPPALKPADLVYPRPTITASVGQVITPDIPTVTGTVTSYSVSPSLPAGLSLDTSSGTVSGTPTATAAQTSYTVTASNAVGSTSATLQITVNAAAPSNLVYPQPTITASVGQTITPDIPTVTGTVTSYSISPSLPGGLNLDTSSGVISGTPNAIAAQVSYTVTATNAQGDTTSSVRIAVIQGSNVLLDLGHATGFVSLRFENNRVLSADGDGHWVLWNYTSGALLASGDGTQPHSYPEQLVVKPIDMAGQTAVVGIANGLEVRAISDGHLISMITYPGLNLTSRSSQGVPWYLAADGSYICIAAQTGLFVFTPTGQIVTSKPGDYSGAQIFAAPNAILVGLGPAAANAIETISTVDGTSSIGPVFSGTFQSWFLDGGRFLTCLGNTVWVYSNNSVQQAIVALPTIQGLTGQDNWIWTSDGTLQIYAIGATTPSLTYRENADTVVIPSGTTLGILSFGAAQVTVIDLSGPNPSQTDSPVPIAYLDAYAATSSSQWVAGNEHGALLDGASLSSTARYFGHGAAWSIAGSSDRVAISTAIGEILVFDPSVPALEQTISFSSGKLALSSDGTVLGASANANDSQYEPDRTLNFYSLPSGAVISSFPYTFQNGFDFFDFSLAASGSTIGQVTGTFQSSIWTLSRKVTDITGVTVIWSDMQASGGSPLADPILISPNGTLIAEYPALNPNGTSIIKNGALVTAIPGTGIGWIDDNQLLASTQGNTVIYNAAGVQLSSPPLPQLTSIQPVTSNSVYDATHNAIYSLATGQPIWTGSFLSSGVGAVSASYVVYESGHSVVVEIY